MRYTPVPEGTIGATVLAAALRRIQDIALKLALRSAATLHTFVQVRCRGRKLSRLGGPLELHNSRTLSISITWCCPALRATTPLCRCIAEAAGFRCTNCSCNCARCLCSSLLILCPQLHVMVRLVVSKLLWRFRLRLLTIGFVWSGGVGGHRHGGCGAWRRPHPRVGFHDTGAGCS